MLGRFLIFFTGAAVLLYSGALVWFSDKLTPQGDSPVPGDLILLFVGVTLVVSILHVGACLAAHREPPRVFMILVIGAIARLILLFGSPGPLLEGDHARIRFDARLTNRGINAYAHRPLDLEDDAPTDFLLSERQRKQLRRVRAELSASADAPRPEQVQRPDLRTTSTPLALALGAAADQFKPQNTRGYAFFILCADALAVFFLLLALRSMELPLAWAIVYVWCPTLLRESYCTLSVDAFVLPGIAALVFALVSGRRVIAGIGAAVIMALRPAFVLIAPVLVRRSGFVAVALGLALAVSTFLPYLLGPDGNPQIVAEGPIHAWRHLEFNSMAEYGFRLVLSPFEWLAENTLSVAGVELVRPGESLFPLAAKLLCFAGVLAVAAYRLIRVGNQLGDGRSPGLTDLFAVIAAFLVFSPVLHPSMTLWLLPILAVRMYGLAWLCLPTLATLSYLPHINGANAADYELPGTSISYRVIEFGIFGVLLIVDRLRHRDLFPTQAAEEEDHTWRVESAAPIDVDEEIPAFELA